jgi:DMSO/TMAO reductase YedYZ molybdopterin-dependent catalytic subunit
MNRRHWIGLMGGAAFALEDKNGRRILNSSQEAYEMPMSSFAHWITPVEQFFIRSHHGTPRVDPSDYRLAVGGLTSRPITLTLDEIKRMPAREIVAVCECAGNGRTFYEPVMPGLQWRHGGVGNGRWRGVRLRDVLERAGVKPEAKFVHMDGADVPLGTQPNFERSIPLAKAMDDNTLLAYDMNGAPLTPSHGFPLRLVAPGWASDCWVKWLNKIELTADIPDVFYMKTAYRHPGFGVRPGQAVKPEDMKPVEELQIKSVIASPLEGETVRLGAQTIAGAAWSGETRVASVEVSLDQGRTWGEAQIVSPPSEFGFRLWQFAWKPARSGYHVIMARAIDAKGRTQPFRQEWNPAGYGWNVVHQVAVEVADTPRPAPKMPEVSHTDPPESVKKACLTCHGMPPISQQNLTRAQWEAEVSKMERWGAPVTDSTRGEIVDWLLNNFGPRR